MEGFDSIANYIASIFKLESIEKELARELKIKKSLQYFEEIGMPKILDVHLLLEGREPSSSIVIFISILKGCLEEKFKNYSSENEKECLTHGTKGDCQKCNRNEISLSILENLIEEKRFAY